MLDHDDGDAARRKLVDQRGRALDLGAVQSGIDLVEEQQLGLHRQRLGEFQALAHRQRQRRRGLIGLRFQADKGEMFARASSRARSRRSRPVAKTAPLPRRYPAR